MKVPGKRLLRNIPLWTNKGHIILSDRRFSGKKSGNITGRCCQAVNSRDRRPSGAETIKTNENERTFTFHLALLPCTEIAVFYVKFLLLLNCSTRLSKKNEQIIHNECVVLGARTHEFHSDAILTINSATVTLGVRL